MAHTVNSNEIAHLWAHQAQSSAKCSSAMSFEGKQFFSYGTVIAEIAKGVDGSQAFFVAEHGFSSVTTSKHQGVVNDSLPYGAKVFTVPAASRFNGDRFLDSTRILEALTRQVGYRLEDANKAREPKKSRLIGEAATIVANMREIVSFFGVKKAVFPLIPGTAAELADVMAKREAKAKRDAKAEAKRKEKADAEARVEAAKYREDWLAGATDSTSWARHFPTELRIEEDEVVTSQGAYFPIEHAQRGLTLVESVMSRGEEWKTNGHTCHLGHYKIDRITPDGTVYAGCHVVTFPAIQRIAAQVRAFVPASKVA